MMLRPLGLMFMISGGLHGVALGAVDVTDPVPEEVVQKFTFSDNRGSYQFIADDLIQITPEGPPVHVLRYSIAGKDAANPSDCIVILKLAPSGQYQELFKSATIPDGAAPVYDGIDVLGSGLGQADGTVFSIRWHTPGSGQLRTVNVCSLNKDSVSVIRTTTARSINKIRTWSSEK